MATAKELLEEGKLSEAIQLMNDEVKRNPTDIQRRSLLAEMLCATGRLERADAQLEVMLQQDSKAALGVALMRQMIRAETARRDFYSAGRLPEFLDVPPPYVQKYIEASIRAREKRFGEAKQLLDQAEAERPHVKGSCNGRAFDDLRDLDDMTAAVFEVLTSTGKYYWIPVERVHSIEFRKPERLRDLIWRRAAMSVESGPDGEVFLPATYCPANAAEIDDKALLGRITEWRGGDAEPMRGIGQVSFLVGDESVPIMQMQSITFDGKA
jgi:type VI secretion system protein ImpE